MYKIKLVDFCSNLRYNDLYRERSHKARYMSLRQINLIFLNTSCYIKIFFIYCKILLENPYIGFIRIRFSLTS